MDVSPLWACWVTWPLTYGTSAPSPIWPLCCVRAVVDRILRDSSSCRKRWYPLAHRFDHLRLPTGPQAE
eukprot:2547331-Alexandrium_andersonii.AAC.1